jgi:hypothetical protein
MELESKLITRDEVLCRAEALILTSWLARRESAQPSECAEVSGLQTIFFALEALAGLALVSEVLASEALAS